MKFWISLLSLLGLLTLSGFAVIGGGDNGMAHATTHDDAPFIIRAYLTPYTSIVLEMNEPVFDNNNIPPADFRLTGDGTLPTVTNVRISGSMIILGLSSPITGDADDNGLTFFPSGSSAITDADGNVLGQYVSSIMVVEMGDDIPQTCSLALNAVPPCVTITDTRSVSVSVTLRTDVASPTNLDVIPVTAQFSEVVTQFDAGDIELSSGDVQNFVFIGDAPIYNQTIGSVPFDKPNAIMQHSNGNIYVVERDNDRVSIFDGTTHARIGQLGNNVSGSGPGVFSSPENGIMEHSNGDVYVVDTGNSRVQIFDSTAHTYKDQFGSRGNGAGQLFLPSGGIMQHSNGDIYIPSPLINRIQIFDGTTHAFKSTFGTNGVDPGQFNGPKAIMQHTNGDIYVSNTINNRVDIFDGTTNVYKSTFGGGGTGDGMFSRPNGIIQHSNGDIYVVDSNNDRVQIFDGTAPHTFKAKFGSSGQHDGGFNNPVAIMEHSNTDVYVADNGDNRVQAFEYQLHTYTFEVSNPNDNETLTVSIPAGVEQNDIFNPSLASNVLSLVIDVDAPTVESITATLPTMITITTSEPVTGSNITPGDFVITNVGSSLTVSDVAVSGTTITLTLDNAITDTDTGLRLSYSEGTTIIEDAAGNTLAAFPARTITNNIDFTAPTVAITSTASNPTNLNAIPFTALFDENVSGFEAGDIIISSGTVQNLTPMSPSPPAASSYTFEVANPEDQATLTVRIPAGAAQDSVTLDNVASEIFSINTDRIVPTVTIATGATSPTNADPIRFTIVFSKQVTEFVVGDITATSGTVQNLSPTYSPSVTSYAFDVAGSADEAVLNVSMSAGAVQDTAGNANAVSNTVSVSIDRIAPTVSAISVVEGDATSIQLETSEPVYAKNIQANRFTIDDVTSSLTVTTVGITNGTNIITLTLSAAISNADTATGTVSYATGTNNIVDESGNVFAAFDDILLDPSPITTLQTDVTSPTNADLIPFTARFNKDVTGFAAADITKSSGTIQNFTFSAAPYIQSIGGPSAGSVSDQFQTPRGIMQAADGRIYVSDATNHHVQIFDSQGRYLKQFGVNGNGDGEFNFPSYILQATNGEIYVSDTNNNRIQVFDMEGIYQRQFGNSGSETLNRPEGIMQAADGNIYVADTFNAKIQVFTIQGVFVKAFGASGTQQGEFDSPRDIMQAANGDIYVTDFGRGLVQVFYGNGTSKSEFGAGDPMDSSPSENGDLNTPHGIMQATDGRIYVVDNGNSRVQIFDNTNQYDDKFDSNLQTPVGIMQASNGNIYVTEETTRSVQIFSPVPGYAFEILDSTNQDTLTVSIPAGASQDGDGNTNRASNVLSLDIDRDVPTVSSITTGNTTSIIIEISEMMPPETRMTSSGFTVSNVATMAIVSAVDISGTTITLTLSASMTDDDSPSLTYAADPGNPIADAAGNTLASFSAQSVTNNLDTTIPTVSAISVAEGDAASIQLETSEPVFADNISSGRFTIGDVVSSLTVTAVGITNGTSTITLTLSAAISDTDAATATVSYATGANDIVDAAGNILAPFSDIPLDPSPIVTLQTDATSPTNLDPVPFTVQFSKDVTGFDAGDITATSGTVQSFAFSDVPHHVQNLAVGIGSGAHGIAQAPNGNIYTADVRRGIVIVFDGITHMRITQFASLGAGDNQLTGPRGILYASNDKIYVVDSANHRIQVFDGITHAYLEQFGPSDTPGGMSSPRGITQASDGNIYVADTDNERILIYNGTTHAYISQFGSEGSGNGQFNSPSDVIQASNGNIYIADTSNHRIQVFDGTSHAYISQFGSRGSGDGLFNFPNSLTQVSSGEIYVSDSNNNRVQVFDGTSHAYISQFGSLGTGDGEFNIASDIIQASNGNIYVADSTNNRIQIFSTLPTYTFEVSGSTNQATLTVSILAGISQDGDGNANRASNIISLDIDRIVPTVSSASAATPTSVTLTISKSVSGTDITPTDFTIGGVGTSPVVTAVEISGATITLGLSAAITDSDDTPTVSYTAASNPITDAAGNVLAAFGTQSITNNLDTTAPTVISASATTLTSIALVTSEPVSGDSITPGDFAIDNVATSTMVSTVVVSGSTITLTLSPAITDSDDTPTVSYTPSGNPIEDAAGNALASFSARLITNDLDTTRPTVSVATSVTGPTNLDSIPFTVQFSEIVTGFDISDITKSSGTVENFDSSHHLENIDEHDASFPTGIAINSIGHIYVIEINPNTIHILDSDGQNVGRLGGGLGSGNGQFNVPLGITINSTDHIYVSDNNNDRVQIFSNSGTYLGQFGVTGSDNGEFDGPRGITINSTGYIYVVDNKNDRVQIFDSNHTYQGQIGGVINGTGDGEFDIPYGIALDSNDNIYVTEFANDRVQIFDRGGTYQRQFGSVINGTGPGEFNGPTDIALDSNDNIYVSELLNDRVQIFSNDGTYQRQFGGVIDGTGDGEFNSPRGIAIDSNGDIYVSDAINSRVQKFAPTPIHAFDITNPTDQETLTVSVSANVANDAAALGNTPSNVASLDIDRAAPTVLSASTVNNLTVRLVMSEPVFAGDIAPQDFGITGVAGGDPTVSTVAITNNTSLITLTLSGPIALTDAAPFASYTKGSNSITDAAGNALVTFSTQSISNNLDTEAPTVTSVSAADPTTLTLTVSEPVSGDSITPTDFVISNVGTSTTVSTVVVSGSTITLTLSPAITDSDTTSTVSYTPSTNSIEDAAGNALAAFTPRLITNTLDTTAPTVSVTTTASDPTNAAVLSFTVQFSENVSGFDTNDVTVSSGDVQNLTPESSSPPTALQYTFDVANSADQASLTVSISAGAAQDAAANDNTASDTISVGIDRTAPTVSAATAATPTSVVLTVSESVSGTSVTASDFTIGDVTDTTMVTAVNISGSTITLTLSVALINSDAPTVSYSAASSQISDDAGNALAAFGPQPITNSLDTTVPTVTLTSIASDPTNRVTLPFIVEFSEIVTGFDATDISISSGTVQNFDTSHRVLAHYGVGSFNTGISDVAVNSTGHIFVLDDRSGRIDIINKTAHRLDQFGDRASGTGDGRFNSPRGITVNSNDEIYIVDSNNNRVQKFSNTGGFLDKFGSAGTGDSQFNSPTGITINSTGYIFVVDTGNDRVQIFDSAHAYQGQIGGAADSTAEGQFNAPRHIALDSNDNIYVTGFINDRVQVFDRGGTYQRVIGGTINSAADGQFNGPDGIALDSNDNIYVSDRNNDRVQILDNDGTYKRLLGNSNSFDNPRGIAIDSDSNIYIADRDKGRVSIFSISPTYTFDITNSTDQAVLTVSIPAGAAQDVDAIDNIASNVISLDIDRVEPVISSAIVTNSTAITLTTSEPVFSTNPRTTDFTIGSVDSSPRISTVVVSGDTITLKLHSQIKDSDVAPTVSYIPTFKITDAADNKLAAFDAQPITNNLDTTAPTVVSAAAVSTTSVVLTISEPVSGDNIAPSDFQILGILPPPTAVTAIEISGNTITLTLSIPLIDSATPSLTYNAASGPISDAAGHALGTISVQSITNDLDNTIPIVTVSTTVRSPTALDTIPFTVRLNEEVSGFDVSDIVVSSGTVQDLTPVSISSLSSTVLLYTFNVVNPADQTTLTVSIPAGAVQDDSGNSNTVPSTITIDTDRTAPVLSSAITASTTTIALTISESVSGTGITPTDFTIDDVATPTTVSTVDVSGSTITLTLSVPILDSDSPTVSYTAASSPISNAAGNTLAAFGPQSITNNLDNIAPTVILTSTASDPTNAATIPFTAQFSENVSGFDTSDVTVSSGTIQNLTLASSPPAASLYTFDVANPTDQTTLTVSIPAGAAQDAATNGNTASNTVSVGIDRTTPIVTSAVAVTTTSVVLTISEPVSGSNIAPSDFRIFGIPSPPTVVTAVEISGDTITLTLSIPLIDFTTPSVTYTAASGPISNAEGRALGTISSQSVTNNLDTTIPTVTVSTTIRSPTALDIIPFTVRLNEPVSGFDVSDITVSSGTVQDLTPVSISSSSSTVLLYIFNVTNPTDRTTLTVSIPAGAVQDGSGNSNTVSSTITIDTDRTAPVLSSAIAASTTTIALTISESVSGTGITPGDFTIDDVATSTTISAVDVSGSIIVLTLSVPIVDSDSPTVSYTAAASTISDDAGNTLAAFGPQSVSINLDTTAPTVTFASAATPTFVTLTVSEPISGNNITPTDFTIGGVATSPTVSSVDVFGTTITLTLSDPITGSDTPTVSYTATSNPISDAAGNALGTISSQSVSINLEVTPPTVTSAVAVTTTSVVLTISEPVSGSNIAPSDFRIFGIPSPPTVVTAVEISGNTITLTLSIPLIDSTTPSVTYTAASGPISNAEGNALGTISSQSVTNNLDTTIPTVTVSTTIRSPTALDIIPFTVRLNEEISGFDVSDITVSSGTVQDLTPVSLSSSSTVLLYTFNVVNPADQTTLTVSIPAGAVQDGSGNSNAVSSMITIDINRSIPVLSSAAATSTTTITLTISEPVSGTGITPTDFTIGGVATSTTVSSVDVSGSTITLTLSVPITGSDTPTVSYTAASNPISTAAGYALAAFGPQPITNNLDTTAPTVSIVTTGPNPTNSATIPFVASFSENVSGFDTSDIIVSSGTPQNITPASTSPPTALQYRFEVANSTDQTTLTVSIPAGAAQDASANDNVISNTISVDIDRTVPVITSAVSASATSVELTVSESVSGDSITLTDFVIGDVTTATIVTAVDVSGTTITLTLSVPIVGSDSPTVAYTRSTVAITDGAGNILEAFGARSITNDIDTSAPTVMVATSATSPTNADPISFTAQFSETVTGFDTGDVVASSGTVENFASTSGTISYLQTIGSNGQANGEFNSPYDVAVNSTGYLYVVELSGARVQIFDSAGQYVGKFGSSGTGNSQFTFPAGIAIDSNDDIYIADQNNNRIQKFTSDGTYQSQFGGFGTGDSQFDKTIDIAINSTGHLFVADNTNDRIQIFDSNGTYQAQFGSLRDGSGDGQFNAPRSIAIDSDDNIYVTDSSNRRVQIFDSDGIYQRQFNNAANGALSSPHGIAIDSDDNIYVADGNNHRILVFGNDGTYQAQFGVGTSGSANNQFSHPRGITIDPDGNIYVADNSNHRVQKLSISPSVYTFDVSGSTDQGTLTVSVPAGVSQDGDGNTNAASDIISLDIDRVVPTVSSAAVTTSTSVALTISESVSGTSVTPGDFTIGGVAAPTMVSTVVIDGTTITLTLSVPITGSDAPTVSYSAASNPISDDAGNALATFSAQPITNGLDTTPPTILSATVTTPTSVTLTVSEPVSGTSVTPGDFTISGVAAPTIVSEVDVSGSTITLTLSVPITGSDTPAVSYTAASSTISDGAGNALATFSTQSITNDLNPAIPTVTVATSVTSPTNTNPIPFTAEFSEAVTGFDAGDVVASSGTVQNFIPSTISTISYLQTIGEEGTANGQFDSPYDIAINSTGHIYVVELIGNRVQIFDSAGQYVGKFGARGSGNGQFTFPSGIAIDSNDNVYIADQDNHRIQKFTSNGTYQSQFGESGMANGQFRSAADIAINSTGHLFAVDFDNDRVQIFDSDGTYQGQIGSVRDTTGDGEFNQPRSIAIDSDDNIYVNDGVNNRIQIFDNGGTYQRQFASGFGIPYGIALDSDNNIYVVNGNGHSIHVFGNDGTPQGQFGDDGTSGSGNNQFNSPRDITIDSDGSIYVADDGNNRVQKLSASHQTTEYAFEVLGSADQSTLTVSVPAGVSQDGDGNTNYASNVISLDIDKSVPTVSSAAAATSTSVTLTISESVSGTGVTSGDFTIGDVTTATTVSAVDVSGSTITLTLSVALIGSDTPTVSYTAASSTISDDAGNTLAAFGPQSITNGIDNTAPTVSIVTTGPNPTNSATISFTATFSENVSGFDTSDITASSGTPQNITPAPTSPPTALQYTFEVANSTDQTTLTVSIPAGAAQDAATNGNTASNIVSVGIDRTAPVITSAVSASTTSVVLTVSESVSGANIPLGDFAIGDVTTATTVSTVVVSGSTITLTLSVPVIDSDSPTVAYTRSTTAITDDAGNVLEAFAARSISDGSDTTAPTVTITSTGPNPTNAATVPLIAQFSKNVSGFDASDITISSGTIQNFVMAVSPIKTIASANSQNFTFPRDVELDSAGNFYVTDTNNERIIVFDDDGTYLREIAVDGNPLGITLNSTDHIFVSDRDDRVLIYDNSGTFIKEFGDRFGDNGIRFDFRSNGLATDANDNLYVTVDGRNNIQIFDSNGAKLRQFGSFGSNNTEFSSPTDIALDSDGKIYVVDTNNHRIQVFYNNGTYLRQFGSQGSNNNQFDAPSGIAIGTDGRIYISDTGNNRIQVFDSQDNYLATFTSPTLTSDRTFMGPTGIAVDARGNLYVAEPSSNLFKIFPSVPALVPILEHAYTFDVANPDDQATLTVSIPAGAAQDASANGNVMSNTVSVGIDRIAPVLSSASAATPTSVALTISESVSGTSVTPGDFTISSVAIATIVSAVDVSGITITLTLSVPITGSDTPTVSYTPSSSTIDDDAGNALAAFAVPLITDSLDPEALTTVLSTVASNPTNLNPVPFTVQFRENVSGFVADDITKSSGTIQNFVGIDAPHLQTFGEDGRGNGQFEGTGPEGIAVNSTGHIYVSDTAANRIQIFDSNGQYAGQFGGSGTGDGKFAFPAGIAIDSDDTVYIADRVHHRIQVFSSTGEYQSQFGSNGEGDGEFRNPRYIAVNSTGHIYVTDDDNDRVQIFDSTGTYQGQIGSVVDGTGDGEFNSPYGIAIDSNDNIYVTEYRNDRVQIFDSDNTYQGQFGRNGTGDGEFYIPYGIAIDSSDNIYVTDLGNYRVQIFDSDGTYQKQFGGVIRGTGDGEFNNAYDITLDSSDNIYVTDGSNNRIQKFSSSSGTVYTFEVLDSDDQDTLTVSIPAGVSQDSNGNTNLASNPISLGTDRTVPAVVSITAVDTRTIQLEVSEPVSSNLNTNLATRGFTVLGASTPTNVIIVTASGSTLTLTLTVPVTNADDLSLSYAVRSFYSISDPAGNTLAAFDALPITNNIADTTPPTVTIATSAADPANTEPVPFTINFSEQVTGFAAGDITVSSGTVQSLSPTPSQSVTSYTFTVAGPTNGTALVVSMPADAVQDLAGNANTASNTVSRDISIDPVVPPTRPTAPTRSGGGGGGGGESIPPSLTRSFDNGYKSITINNVGISPERSGANYLQSPPISVSTGVQTPIQIILYENISWNLVSHVELCMNNVVATNQACDGDTKIIWDKSRGDNNLEIVDPHNLINDGSTSVDRSQVSNNVVTFDFDIEFVGAMDVSDLTIHAWDTNRNALVYTVENAIKVVSGGTTTTNDDDDDATTTTNDDDDTTTTTTTSGTTTTNDDDSDNDTDSTDNDNSSTSSNTATFDREILKQWTGFASKSISDTEFLTHVGIYNKDRSSNSGTFGDDDDGVSLPSWTKNMVGKWALQGKISTDELKAVLSYVHDIKSR